MDSQSASSRLCEQLQRPSREVSYQSACGLNTQPTDCADDAGQAFA